MMRPFAVVGLQIELMTRIVKSLLRQWFARLQSLNGLTFR